MSAPTTGTSYVLADGSESTSSSDRQNVSASSVATAWLKQTREIPPQFACGTAQHETDYCTNERYRDSGKFLGHTTDGIFQLDDGDVARAAMPEKNRLDLDDACTIFAAVCSQNLSALKAATNTYNALHSLPQPDWSSPPSDIWAYLALAHNVNLHTAVISIGQYGLDWNAFKARNPSMNVANDRGSGIYGDDVISGGASWDPSYGDASSVAVPFPDAGTSSTLRLSVVAVLLLMLVYAWLARQGATVTL